MSARGPSLRPIRTLIALVTIGLGVALLAVTFAQGGGEVGIALGLLFIVAGGGRLYLMRGR